MESPGQSPRAVVFKTLPNFRRVTAGRNEDVETNGNLLYRSSRPDFLEGVELEAFNSLGIRTIVDCRSKTNYQIATGPKLLDETYRLYTVKLPKNRKYGPKEKVSCFPVEPKTLQTQKPEIQVDDILGEQRKHFLINFFSLNYVKAIFFRAPWYIQILSAFVLLFETIFRTGYIYFVRLFALTVINKAGLEKSYEDMIELSQAGLCAALKILTKEDSFPALINCAHGKDRTGLVTALVLSTLGESEERIVEDYAKSQEGLAPVRQRIYEEIVEHFYWDKSFCDATPENMRKLLTYIKQRYGTVKDYLVHIGFSEEEQEQLRKNLANKGENSWVMA